MRRAEITRRWEQLYAWRRLGWTYREIAAECKARGWSHGPKWLIAARIEAIARRERDLDE